MIQKSGDSSMKMQFTEEQLRGVIAEACGEWYSEVLSDRQVGTRTSTRTPAEFAEDFVKYVSSTWNDTVECPVIKVNCWSCSRLRGIPTCCTNGVSTKYCDKGHIGNDPDYSLRAKWCPDYKPSARAAVYAVADYNRSKEKQ